MRNTKTLFGDLESTTSAMFFLGILFISVANAIVDNDNNNNNNTNIYDGLNEVDCVAVNSTTKCRYFHPKMVKWCQN